MNYSQNDEQNIILKFFQGTQGRFLDIGAFDGVELSNTRALAEIGWTGLMVEPSPYNACRLIESVLEFERRVEIWSCAVSADGKPAVLKMTSQMDRMWATTISPEMPDDYIPDPVQLKLVVPTVRISDLLENGPFQFISLDAEWMDFDILKDSPFGLGEFELICVEPRGPDERKEMIDYLSESLGFEVHAETHENIIARRIR